MAVGKCAVLALQGDFAQHAQRLAQEGFEVTFVKKAGELENVTSLVLPGGESTTLLKVLDESLEQRIVQLIRGGLPTLATCAGLILIANEVTAPAQRSLQLLDITVARNGYGRQIDSFVTTLAGEHTLKECAFETVFIRAPRITRVGEGVTVLCRRGDEPVMVQCGNILGATFHPELSETTTSIYTQLRSMVADYSKRSE